MSGRRGWWPVNRRPAVNSVHIVFAVPPTLKAALEAEAWEEGLTLSQYLRGLLSRRGKWARAVGQAGGYDIGPGEVAPSAVRVKEDE